MSDSTPIHLVEGETQELLSDIAQCRNSDCHVVIHHPTYPTPDAPPFFMGARPCIPVTPTYTKKRDIMFLGHFPNCRFGTVEAPGQSMLTHVPVADVNEPFEAGRYFDGYSIRDYPTAKSLEDYYFRPLGLSRGQDLWLTNMVKCFMMKEEHIKDYETAGWIDPESDTPKATLKMKMDIARLCGRLWLKQEIELCDPKLIIAVGAPNYQTIHGGEDFQAPGPGDIQPSHYRDIIGTPLRAGVDSGPYDNRFSLFKARNVIHLRHPSSFLFDGMEARLQKHLEQDIPNTASFITEVLS